MAWQRLHLEAPAPQQAALETLLADSGAAAVTTRDAGDVPVLEPAPGATPLWPHCRLEALFEDGIELAPLLELLAAGGVQARLAPPLAETDWVAHARAGWQARCFGERLWVLPGDAAPPGDGLPALRLDPGLAFGTGAHPTTALCLEWLAQHPPAGLRVLDYGCGSGILALAAARLGAASVTAVDIDPQALRACADNAARNDLAAALHIAAPTALAAGPFDLLLANILKPALLELAPRFAALVAPGGRLLLSGLLSEQADRLTAAYAPAFDFAPVREREGWVALEGRRHD